MRRAPVAERAPGTVNGFGAQPGALRVIGVIALDGAIAALSIWIATSLRFEGQITEPYASLLPAYALLLANFRCLASLLFKLHRWSFRYSGLAEGARIGVAAVFGTGIFLAAFYLLRDPGPPRSVVVLELLLSTILMASMRFSPRLAGIYLTDWQQSRGDRRVRTLIAGAGAAGEMLLRDLRRSDLHRYQVVGFVDDDPTKHHTIVGRRTVLGSIAELPQIVREQRVEQLLIAIPRIDGVRVRQILTACRDLKLRFKILSTSFLTQERRSPAQMMENLVPEDLLQREVVSFDRSRAPDMRERRALVTGAAGSIGSEICLQLLRAGLRSLTVVDLNENGLYLLQRRMQREFPSAEIASEIGDIRDVERMEKLFSTYRPQDVFHTAAHKHVPLMESAPGEAVKNNVFGTKNVASAADRWGAERFVYISTDKAVRPSSVMGATKRLGEEIVRAFARRSQTRYCAVRFGNVLGSAGSVVPLFLEQIAAGGPVTVTDPDVRRYFMTIGEAVALVLEAGYGDFGELCILDMGEPILIADLARDLITMAGLVPGEDIAIEFTGLRPGEKLHEQLISDEESVTTRVHRKILVTAYSEPNLDVDRDLARLEREALTGNDRDVRRALVALVPTYKSPATAVPELRVAAEGRAAGAGRPRIPHDPLPPGRQGTVG